MNRKGFTLIELLIVVAIIGILAAIAILNFLQAQTRAKVARVKAEHATIATALESYAVDENRYPREADTDWFGDHAYDGSGDDVSGILCSVLTTPIDYLSTITFYDTFQRKDTDYNHRVYTYHNLKFRTTPSFWVGGTYATTLRWSNPSPQSWRNQCGGWRLGSIGPDGDYKNLTSTLINNPQTNYDPTNGTVSLGNIWRLQKSAEPAINDRMWVSLWGL